MRQWTLAFALLLLALPASAQTYTHEIDPTDFDRSHTNHGNLPNIAVDLSAVASARYHRFAQYHTGMHSAPHDGPVIQSGSPFFLFGMSDADDLPGGDSPTNNPECLDDTYTMAETAWSHGHYGVNDCPTGGCELVVERAYKCNEKPATVPGAFQLGRDGHIYHVYPTSGNLAGLVYGVSQFGPDLGRQDGGPTQHGGPILVEMLRPNSAGELKVWGSNMTTDPSTARLRVAVWYRDGTSEELLDIDIPDWPVTNPVLTASWEGDAHYLVVDGTVDVSNWYAGILRFDATGGPIDTDGDGVIDPLDNCLDVANPSQQDPDGDGFGSHCDADFDQSFVADTGAAEVNSNDYGSYFIPCFQQGAATPGCEDEDMDGSGTVNANDFSLFQNYYNTGKNGRTGLQCVMAVPGEFFSETCGVLYE